MTDTHGDTLTDDYGALREMLKDCKRGTWMVLKDGRTVIDYGDEDQAKWIGEVEPREAETIVAAVNALPAILNALDRAKRGGRTLGDIVNRMGREMVDATGAHGVIGEDGDGDWALVSELLHELRPARDAAISRAQKAEDAIERVRSVIHDLEFSTGMKVQPEQIASSLRAALDGR